MQDMWVDLLNGRLFLRTDRSLPWLEGLMETRIALIPQRGIAEPAGVIFRYICDPLPYINDRTSSTRHPFCFTEKSGRIHPLHFILKETISSDSSPHMQTRCEELF